MIEAAAVSSQPKSSATIFVDREDRVMAETVRIIGIVNETDKSFPFAIRCFAFMDNQLVESAAGADPKRAGAIFINGPNPVVA